MTEGSNKGLSAPVPERRVIDQPEPTRRPSGDLGHVGFHRGLVDKNQPFKMVGHEGLTPGDPDMAQPGDILALLLKSLKVFFCVSSRARAAPAIR